jgi:putative ABC transport system permease protein
MKLAWLVQELSHLARRWRRQPLQPAAVVLLLAAGLGASALLFAIADRVLLRPLPYPDADRLVAILKTDRFKQPAAFSPRQALSLQRRAVAFAEVAAFQFESFNYRTAAGDTECIQGVVATPNLFRVLASRAARGRVLSPRLDGAASRTVVISRRFRERYLGSQPEVIGAGLVLDGESFTVVGVMAGGFRFDRGTGMEGGMDFAPRTELWTSAPLDPGGSRNYLLAIGALQPGVSAAQASARLAAIARQDEGEGPPALPAMELAAVELHDQAVRPLRATVLLLVAGAVLLLVIAFANAANLLIAQAIARRAELGIRIALGAARPDVVAASVVETLAHCVSGWALAMVWFGASGRVVVRALQGALPGLDSLAIDGRLLAATLVPVVLFAAALGALRPALAARGGLRSLLDDQGRGRTAGRHGALARRLFLAFQLALSFILLQGAALACRSMLNLLAVDRGFAAAGVLTAQLALPAPRRADGRQVAATLTRVLAALNANRAVAAAGLVSVLPLGGTDRTGPGLTVEGPTPIAIPAAVSTPLVGGAYFSAMGIRLLAGRYLTDRDTATAPGAAVVSAALARRYLPAGAALGSTLTGMGGRLRFTVVGVVADIRHASLRVAPQPILYVPFGQVPPAILPVLARPATLVVRGRQRQLPPETVFRDALRAVAPAEAVFEVRPMAQVIGESLATERLLLWTMAAFAAAALLLAVLGAYAMLARAVVERRQEIGIRLALGAAPSAVVALVLGDTAKSAGAGILAGILVAVASSRFLGSQLFGLAATDPLTLVAVAAFLMAAVLLAGGLPAVRSSRLDPWQAIVPRPRGAGR